jgi:hypothetical protein
MLSADNPNRLCRLPLICQLGQKALLPGRRMLAEVVQYTYSMTAQRHTQLSLSCSK